jgi:hypothetical protein
MKHGLATPDLNDLEKRTQDNLTKFLQAEVGLAGTFCKMVETTQSPAHRAKLLGDIRKAADALRHFGQRITDTSIRDELNREADKLDKFLAANSK